MRPFSKGSLRLLGLALGYGVFGIGMAAAPAQQTVSPYYTAPGNYGTSYGTSSYGSVRTHSNYGPPTYGRGLRPYAVANNQWGRGIWGQASGPAPVPNPAPYTYQGRYGTWTDPRQQAQRTLPPAPPIGAYAPTVGPGYGIRRPSAY
jgi:hypothetical protein